MLGEDSVIPTHDNTQHVRSSGGSNQLFTEKSGIDSRENLCGVPPEVADHGDIVGAQLDDDFGCHVEMNAGKYNHQYNEMYNDMNNERNNEPHNLLIHEVANEPNLHPVYNVANNEEDEELFEMERCVRRVRHVHRCSSTTVHIVGTSEVQSAVTPADSDNARTWVIPEAESYSFGMGGSRNLVEDEPTSMIYKGQFFPTKKDLKRLAGHFAMRHNFEWKEIHRRHRQASEVIIGELVAPRLQQHDGRLMRPKDIIADMKTMYGIQIMYSKAYQALDYALSLTYGMHEESFQLLPSFGYVLEQQNPRTITNLQCNENGKFLYFFMSLGASARGFQRCMRPVIVVDGTHLKGRFVGTMFVATAQDWNEQVYPIAFRYGDSKNNLSWEWFLDCLKGAFGHIDDLVFIYDLYASIEAEISKVFPHATHTIYCWHFYKNIKKRYHRKDVAAIMDKAARTYTELQYNRHMEELRNLHPNAYEYVIDVSPQKWSRVHYPDRRYRVMTTNDAECINSCLKFARQLPMLTLAEFIRNMLQRWFHDWHKTAQSMRHQLTDAAHLVILKRVDKCNLARKTYTCNKFQMNLLPCSHTLATARDRNMDFTSLCADYYKRQTLIDAYSVPIMPVGHPSTWIVPSDIAERVVLNPSSRRQAGRSRASRRVSSSKRTTTQNCRRCRQPGHNLRRCSNPALSNEGLSQFFLRNTDISVVSVIQLVTTDRHALLETPPWNDLRCYHDDIVII
ncbi:hypothetical protein Ddye_024232 [Dipteronia dyeriana]|uniref:Zinc finger PMZ-type domain-containing protein n=1 Tax=Dipteronia dyeriana TaxID=168575 RepID=A0AAD9TVD9_9ROSI|nr:hypothetical protein Ddye_024232 [Dipteronia dyeriana]